MNDSSIKNVQELIFRTSASQAQAIVPRTPPQDAMGLSERIRNALSREHLMGTASILVHLFTTMQGMNAAREDKDWIRVGTGGVGILSPTALLLSSRSGSFPEAGRFVDRVAKAALHPDIYSHHAAMTYGVLPTVVSQLNNLYKGISGPKDEKARIVTAVLTLTSQAITWQSMFGHKQGVGRTGTLTPKKDTFLQFVLHDTEGLIGRLLPLATRISGLIEGKMKINSGRPSGKNFFMSSAIEIASFVVHIGYTYQQLWKAHQEEQKNSNHDTGWTQEIIEKNTPKIYNSSVKNR